MTQAICFSRDQLRRYLLGELQEELSDEVALHVETCINCEATVAELDRDSDTLMQSLRTPAVRQELGSAYRLAARQAVARLREASLAESEAIQSVPKRRILRDYELLEALARGGMGTVYRARHLRLNRDVALKVLPGRWLQDAAVVSRFQREMQAVGSLRHPAIVQATDGGEADGIHFLVMELIDGIDGSTLVQYGGPLPIADACELVRQAAVGMAYVHQQGIIHRDLKPSNLMVTAAGEVKVLDLGLARLVGKQLAEDELTTVGQLMGTLDFMAPEQLENSHEVDERADIYALGATLYKLLTGSSPHASNPHEPLLSKLSRIATGPPRPLSELRPDASPELSALVDSMLARDKQDRPSSMDAVAHSLLALASASDLPGRIQEAEQLRRQRALEASAEEKAPPSNGAPEDQKPVITPASQSHRRRGGRALVWAATLVVLLAMAALGVIITVQTSSGQLVIETATPDIEVRVLKAGEPYRKLTLTQKANALRLGAGQYEVEIIGPSDALEIENGSYTLKRGETWVARIVHRIDASEQRVAEDEPLTDDQPTYEGKTLDEWLAQLRQDRSVKQFAEAMPALEHLTTHDDVPRAVAAVLAAARHHRQDARYLWEGLYTDVWHTAQQFLAAQDQRIVANALTSELDQDAEANAMFVLGYLTTYTSVHPFVDERLVAHLERLAAEHVAALTLLEDVAPEEVAERHLRAALSDRETLRQLAAARELIEMESSISAVVSTLASIVESGDIYQRAEAAWLLGDLGSAAAPAVPALAAVVQEKDDEVTRRQAHTPMPKDDEVTRTQTHTPTPKDDEVTRTQTHTPTPIDQSFYPVGGGLWVRGVSTKDAAIRALAEIGDESVVPVLVEEWERRAVPEDRSRQAVAAWERPTVVLGAYTPTPDWVADAIEQLSGMRPTLEIRDQKPLVIWTTEGLTLESIYRETFQGPRNRPLSELLKAAQKLMPRVTSFEHGMARFVITQGSTTVEPNVVELQINLIELLAEYHNSQQVLGAMLQGWKISAFNATPDSDAQAAAIESYKASAVRLVKAQENWESTVVPSLIKLAEAGYELAGVVLMALSAELNPDQQLQAVMSVLRMMNQTPHSTILAEELTKWLEDPANQAAFYEQLREASGDRWQNAIVGLLRGGLFDDGAIEIVKERVADDSIDRLELLRRLLRAVDYRTEIAKVVVDLLRHPALDVPANVMVRGSERTEESFRAYYLSKLHQEFLQLHSSAREALTPLLQELAESGINGEAAAARAILQSWK